MLTPTREHMYPETPVHVVVFKTLSCPEVWAEREKPEPCSDGADSARVTGAGTLRLVTSRLCAALGPRARSSRPCAPTWVRPAPADACVQDVEQGHPAPSEVPRAAAEALAPMTREPGRQREQHAGAARSPTAVAAGGFKQLKTAFTGGRCVQWG